MGYYTRADIPFYYALADGFTICDNFFCSVMARPTRTASIRWRHPWTQMEKTAARSADHRPNRTAFNGRLTYTTMPSSFSPGNFLEGLLIA